MPTPKPHPFNLVIRYQGKIEGHQITTEFSSALKSPEFLLSPLNNKIWDEIKAYPKTEVYPMQGGLVVIDFDHNWIGQAVDHIAFEGFHVSTLPNLHLKKAFKQGWVNHATVFSVGEGWRSESLSALGFDNFETLQAQIKLGAKAGHQAKLQSPTVPFVEIYTIQWHPKDWTIALPTVNDHHLPIDTVLELFKNLLEKGFQLEPWVSKWKEYAKKVDGDEPEWVDRKIDETLINYAKSTLQKMLPETIKAPLKKKI